MLRIFMVGYSENRGGVETYIDQLTAALPQYEFVYSLPRMEIGGKVWHRPPNRHRYLRYRLFWRKFFTENRFDALYYNTCDMVSIDMLRFAKAAGIPIRIIHAHNSGIQQTIDHKLSLFHRLTERRNRKVLDRYATHLFACSRAAGDWMFDGRPYTVVKNGIQISKYAFREDKRKSIRQSLGLEDEVLVGVVGRLSAQKNPFFAVSVLRSLMREMPSAKAVFLGDGDLRKQVENAVREAGIQSNVYFMGNVSNVNEWLSAMDVLLMPSLFEGLPFALVEAQANGLSCIVSSAVCKEADLTGLVWFEEIEEAPEKWVTRILNADMRIRPDTSQQLIQSGYSIDNTVKNVSDIIDSYIKNGLIYHER